MKSNIQNWITIWGSGQWGPLARVAEQIQTSTISKSMTWAGSNSDILTSNPGDYIQDAEDNLFRSAVSDHMNNSYGNARNKYQQLVSSTKYAKQALVLLNKLSIESKDNNATEYFEKLRSNFGKLSMGNGVSALATNLLANMQGYQKNYEKAFSHYDEVIKNYPNTSEERTARSQKILYTLEGLKDYSGAQKMLNELQKIYKKGDDIDLLQEAIDHALAVSVMKTYGSLKKEEKIKNAPKEYSLSANYPNPFNPTTTISYAIPQPGIVSLKVYDVLGKEVATFVNEYKMQGRYSVSFDAGRLSSGMYIYRIQADAFTAAKKMNVVK